MSFCFGLVCLVLCLFGFFLLYNLFQGLPPLRITKASHHITLVQIKLGMCNLIRLIYGTISHRPAPGDILNTERFFSCLYVLDQSAWNSFHISMVAAAENFPVLCFSFSNSKCPQFGDTESSSKNIKTHLSADKPKVVNRCYLFYLLKPCQGVLKVPNR